MKPSEVKELLLAEHGRYCENCHHPKDGDPLDCHHVLLHNQKRYADILTNPINCCLICRTCHQNGIVNGHSFRVRFLHKQVERYGMEPIAEWFNLLPDQLKKHSDNEWIPIELFGTYLLKKMNERS
jgi:hypothetical protein